MLADRPCVFSVAGYHCSGEISIGCEEKIAMTIFQENLAFDNFKRVGILDLVHEIIGVGD